MLVGVNPMDGLSASFAGPIGGGPTSSDLALEEIAPSSGSVVRASLSDPSTNSRYALSPMSST